jgi:hypothetical protein
MDHIERLRTVGDDHFEPQRLKRMHRYPFDRMSAFLILASVPDLPRDFMDMIPRLLRHAGQTSKRFGHRMHRKPRLLGQVLQSYRFLPPHVEAPLF